MRHLRRGVGGFVIFAMLFWGVIVLGVGLLSFLFPRYRGGGCLTRVLFAVGGVIGFIVTLNVFGWTVAHTPNEIMMAFFLASLVSMVGIFAVLAGDLGCYLEKFWNGRRASR